MKVYCKDCKFIINVMFRVEGGNSYVCEHPDNINDWFGDERQRKYRWVPEELNFENDCGWFKKIKEKEK